MKNVVFACAVALCASWSGAQAQSSDPLAQALRPIAPNQTQARQVAADLTGVWVHIPEAGYPEILEFTSDGLVMRDHRLARYQVESYRPADPTAQIIREADQAITQFDATLARDDLVSGDRTITENVRKLVVVSRDMALDAQQRGETRLPDVTMAFETLDTGDTSIMTVEFRRARITFRYAGARLYIYDDGAYRAFDRVDALSGEAADTWEHVASHQRNRDVENEYQRLRNHCDRVAIADGPVDACQAWRDQMERFGAQLQPDGELPRDTDFPKPSDAERAFWAAPASSPAPVFYDFPYLNYCYDSRYPGADYAAFSAQLAARGYRDTLWSMGAVALAPAEKPRNFTDAEYQDLLRMQRFGGSGFSVVELRADGVIGWGETTALHYDARNHWSVAGDELTLLWHDAAVVMSFPVGASRAPSSTNLAYAPQVTLELFAGDHHVGPQLDYWSRESGRYTGAQ